MDSIFTKIVESKVKDMPTHFVYAGYFYFHGKRLGSFLLQKMKRYKIKKLLVTKILMVQEYLISKETMEAFCKREIKSRLKESVNDDLESLFENIRRGKKIHLGAKRKHEVPTYFFPKLTKEELELVTMKDSDYKLKFLGHFNDDNDERNPDAIDVDEAEMEVSESDSKYVMGDCGRRTFKIEHPSKLETCCTLQ